MKKVTLCSIVASLLAMTVVADNGVKSPRRRRPAGKPTGGIIEKQMISKVFRVGDATKLLPAETMSKMTLDMRHSVLLPIEWIRLENGAGSPFEMADALVAQKGVGAGVLIVEDAKLPILLTAADRKWTILNVGPLKADAPSPEKLNRRFAKVYWMAVARTLGAGYSSYPGCVMVPFTNMYELDAIKATQPCPEPYNKMLDTGNAFGIKTLSVATYRHACTLGWAPAPTNDVQKAIWDEIHALPAAPLAIKPETKKVSE